MATAASNPKNFQYSELEKCAEDPCHFITTYLYVQHPVKGRLPFNLYPFQRDCINDFLNFRHNIIAKSRQLGLSETVSAYCLWLALFHRDKNIVLMATTLKTAALMVRKIRQKFKMLPDWLTKILKVTEPETNSKTQLSLSNGSTIKAVPATDGAVRGEAGSVVVVDEAAHIDNLKEIWKAIWPVLSCVTGDTKIFTENGIYEIDEFFKNKKIGDYFELNNVNLYGKNGIEKVSHGYVSPESDTKIITTKHGYSIEATLKHPLWKLTNKGGEMCQSQYLTTNDYLRIQTGMNCYGKTNLEPNLAYMLGGYIAKGNCSKSNIGKYIKIQITNQDVDFRNVYLNNFYRFFGKNLIFKKTGSIKLRAQSCEMIEKLKSYDINPSLKCHNKITPKLIWKSTKETQSNYLSGLFDGSGSITNRTISLTSTSLKLIQETQLLLLNMGFHPNITKIDGKKKLKTAIKNKKLLPQGKEVKKNRDAWSLDISRTEFRKFAEEIGFRIKKNQIKLIELSKKYNQDNFNLKTIPTSIVFDTIKNLFNKSLKTKKWFKDNNLRLDKVLKNKKNSVITTKWLSLFRTLLKTANVAETREDTLFFENVIGNFFWDKIVTIQNSTNKTYDFTVPETHTFIQNGILGSNTGGNSIIFSSPNGKNCFYELFSEAEKDANNKQLGKIPNRDGIHYSESGKNRFHAIKLPWTVHPERDQEWFNQESAGMDARGIAQEFLVEFENSGNTYFGTADIQWIRDNIAQPISFYGPNGKSNDLWIWKNPYIGGKYLLTADLARGDAEDFSAFHIIDTEQHEVVAEYMGKIPPDRFAEFVSEIGIKYNNALVTWEFNTYGHAFGTKLRDLKYPNIYYDEETKQEIMFSEAEEKNDLLAFGGITTSSGNREKIIIKVEETIRNRKLQIYSSRFVTQMEDFIIKNSKAQAAKHKNDDLIMCYDDKTEVLTETGWKLFKDVVIGEKILSLNIETGDIELATNLLTIKKENISSMVSFKTKNVDLLVTENHNMLVAKSKGANKYKKWELERADQLLNKHFKLKRNANPWKNKKEEFITIPGFFSKNGVRKPTIKIPINDFMLLLGFYISEGCGNNLRLQIAQLEKTKGFQPLSELIERLKKLGIKCHYYYSNKCFCISDKRIATFVKNLVPGTARDKKIPREFLFYDSSILKYLFEGLFLGDGGKNKKNELTNYVTVSPVLANDVSELILKLGMAPTIAVNKNIIGKKVLNGKSNYEIYTISISRKHSEPRVNHHKKNSVTIEKYNGNVYCLCLDKNHTLYVRRNGKMVWSGNCLAVGLQIYEPASNKNTNNDGMSWHMAFLKSLQQTGKSNSKINTGIIGYGSSVSNNINQPTRNPNGILNPIQSYNTQKEPNKFLGKKLAPGVDPDKVAEDYAVRSIFQWVID